MMDVYQVVVGFSVQKVSLSIELHGHIQNIDDFQVGVCC